MMKPEIDQIISCDEAAKVTVNSAKKEAEDLVAKAKQDANTLKSELEARFDEVKKSEIAPILEDSQIHAQETMAQAERYIQGLKDRVALRKAQIVEDFISEALGEAWSPKGEL
jgi:vacuolar-type H+-ATPase subunit H